MLFLMAAVGNSVGQCWSAAVSRRVVGRDVLGCVLL